MLQVATGNAIKRWMVILLAATMALTGCQSVAVRSQGPGEALPPPEQMDTEQVDAPPLAKAAAKPQAKGQAVPGASASRAERQAVEAVTGAPPMHGAPSELRPTSLPPYVVEPPDLLLIDAVKLIPKPPYHLEALDVVQIVVVGTLLGQDISGQFVIDPSGTVDLGPAYGKVVIIGQTVDEATKTIDKHLRKILREPEVSVTLSQSAGQQQVSGEHLVGPDGTVNLGTYGTVYVAGLTLPEVKDAVEKQLGKYLLNPRVNVDIFAYNSKVYYIISQGAGLGDQVTRVPITGKETVLDAIAQVNGLSRLTSKKIWIARPGPVGQNCDQILPVNWSDITAGASTATNFQILPRDRIFIAEDKFIATDNFVTRITAPIQRIVGASLLGASAVQTFNRFPLGFNGGNSF